ncbi:hypothetical protein FB45DRAFT_1042737 [Roridomyces roridus]|uniref:Uncharacterized protein n=1 Tax=Roridomyces roridus TaxID=1738132 RepID=A0AAD7AZ62_9AGAR|nr:hypothetical protein FB45DRAFT_1042737 [Roridomyces roridus]
MSADPSYHPGHSTSLQQLPPREPSTRIITPTQDPAMQATPLTDRTRTPLIHQSRLVNGTLPLHQDVENSASGVAFHPSLMSREPPNNPSRLLRGQFGADISPAQETAEQQTTAQEPAEATQEPIAQEQDNVSAPLVLDTGREYGQTALFLPDTSENEDEQAPLESPPPLVQSSDRRRRPRSRGPQRIVLEGQEDSEFQKALQQIASEHGIHYQDPSVPSPEEAHKLQAALVFVGLIIARPVVHLCILDLPATPTISDLIQKFRSASPLFCHAVGKITRGSMALAVSQMPLRPDSDFLGDYQTGHQDIGIFAPAEILQASSFSTTIVPPAFRDAQETKDLLASKNLPPGTPCYVMYLTHMNANVAQVSLPLTFASTQTPTSTLPATSTVYTYLSSRFGDVKEVQTRVQAGVLGAAYKGLQFTRAVFEVTTALGMDWSSTGLPTPPAVDVEGGLSVGWEQVAEWCPGCPSLSTFRNWRRIFMNCHSAYMTLCSVQERRHSVAEELKTQAELLGELVAGLPRKDHARVPPEYRALGSQTWEQWEKHAKTVLDYYQTV